MSDTQIGIIIINWQQDDLTRQCLTSLENQTEKHFIILIENECVDKSSFEGFSGIKIIKNEKNLGYSKAINQGLELALKEQPLALLLLNNDAFFENDHALRLMVAGFQEDQRVAAVAAAQINQDITYVQKWAVMHPLLGPEFIGMNQAVDPPGLYEASYVSACCLMIRSAALRDVGVWDEDYFIYFDDIDWSHRARQKKWRLLLQTAVHVRHYDSYTMNQFPKLKYYHMGRGRRLFFRKHYRRNWKLFFGSLSYYLKNMIWNRHSSRRQIFWEFKGFMNP